MRNSAIEHVESTQHRKDVADFRTGDSVRVNWKVKEGDKEREQAFEGTVIRKKRGGVSASFTVRKLSYGVGVERIFPLHSPRYSTIDVLTRGDVRRNRLFYLRGLRGKASKVDVMEEAMPVEAAAAPNADGTPAVAKAPKAPKAPKAKSVKGPKAEKKK